MPFWPLTIESQDESLVAPHAQAASDGVTVKEPVPPAAVRFPDCGLRTKLQVAAA